MPAKRDVIVPDNEVLAELTAHLLSEAPRRPPHLVTVSVVLLAAAACGYAPWRWLPVDRRRVTDTVALRYRLAYAQPPLPTPEEYYREPRTR